MRFPCKKCITLCLCKTIAFDNREDPDDFCRAVLLKCPTIVSHLKYKQCETESLVLKFKPIQFNVFLKFFSYSIVPPGKTVYYLPKQLYKEQSPCILVV